MSELIDRQAALDVLCDACGNCACPKGKIPRCSYYEKMQAIPTASPWHRVEDELPESGEFGEIVLACNDVGTVNAAFLSSRGKWYAANNTMYDAWTWMPNVTHWMPIEPPKEESYGV